MKEFRDAASSLFSLNSNDAAKVSDSKFMSQNGSPRQPSKQQKKSSDSKTEMEMRMEMNDNLPEENKFRCSVMSLETILLENGFDSVDLLKVGRVVHKLECLHTSNDAWHLERTSGYPRTH